MVTPGCGRSCEGTSLHAKWFWVKKVAPCNRPRGTGLQVYLISLNSALEGGGCQRQALATLLPGKTQYPLYMSLNDFAWPECLQNFLTAWSRVLPDKLKVPQPDMKFPTSCRFQRLVSVFSQFSPSWAWLIQSTDPNSKLNIFPRYSRWPFKRCVHSICPHQHPLYISLRLIACCIPCPSVPTSSRNRNNGWRYNDIQLRKELGTEFADSMQLGAFKRILGSPWNSKTFMQFLKCSWKIAQPAVSSLSLLRCLCLQSSDQACWNVHATRNILAEFGPHSGSVASVVQNEH